MRVLAARRRRLAELLRGRHEAAPRMLARPRSAGRWGERVAFLCASACVRALSARRTKAGKTNCPSGYFFLAGSGATLQRPREFPSLAFSILYAACGRATYGQPFAGC